MTFQIGHIGLADPLLVTTNRINEAEDWLSQDELK